jgi:hypothetical protein
MRSKKALSIGSTKASTTGWRIPTNQRDEERARTLLGNGSWTQRAYHKIIYFNEVDKDGHFAAWEQPELFPAEL